MHIKTKYLDDEVVFWRTSYVDGSTAIVLTSPDGEPLMTATVCLAAYGDTPEPGHVFLKTWSENEGIYEALLAAGVIGEFTRVIPAGYAQALECPLTESVA